MANDTLSETKSGSPGMPHEDVLSHLKHGHMRDDTKREVSTHHDPGVIAERMIKQVPSYKYLGIYMGN